MFLFARELTGSEAAAFVAGLAFAFTPLRIASIPHLQVLSAAWMPFVLYGLRRYSRPGACGRSPARRRRGCFRTCRAATTCSSSARSSPLHRLGARARGLWRDATSGARSPRLARSSLAATLPFLLPYLELRRLGFSPRSLAETRRFSADVYAYFTADPNLRLWGPIAQAWPHAEGLLFPGLTIVGSLRWARVRWRPRP